MRYERRKTRNELKRERKIFLICEIVLLIFALAVFALSIHTAREARQLVNEVVAFREEYGYEWHGPDITLADAEQTAEMWRILYESGAN